MRGVATSNEKNRWVLPLAPTDCAYAKLNEYFGKLRGAVTEVLQSMGDFGGKLSVREVSRPKEQRIRSKMESSKTAISIWKK